MSKNPVWSEEYMLNESLTKKKYFAHLVNGQEYYFPTPQKKELTMKELEAQQRGALNDEFLFNQDMSREEYTRRVKELDEKYGKE